ncbi:reverse transcriptase domain-containing protein [Tanacetum coccineum]
MNLRFANGFNLISSYGDAGAEDHDPTFLFVIESQVQALAKRLFTDSKQSICGSVPSYYLRGRKNSITSLCIGDETISRRGGILLYGPPGVRKTLLATTAADEATLNVFLISASQFVEIYVGKKTVKVRIWCGFPFKCFLDAYKGYHQIQMAEEDEEKTTYTEVNTKAIKICQDKEETRGHIVYLAAIKQLALSGGIDWMSKAKQLRKRQRRTMTKEKPGRCRSYFSHPGDSAKEEEPLSAQWTLFTDGSSCVDECGAGVILTDLEGIEFTYALRFQFEATNNEAEYEALIAGLQIAEKMGVQNLEVKYLPGVLNKASPKKQEQALSKMASTSFAHLSKQVLVEGLKEKSVNKSEVLAVVEEEGDSWMSPIHEYLTDETLPAKRKKARAIKRKLQRFAIINGILYKKSFLGPWLRCVGPLQSNYVLREIHEGSCSMHAGTRSVVAKALRTVYILAEAMHKDAMQLLKHVKEMPRAQTRPTKSASRQIRTPITSPAFYNVGYRQSWTFPEGTTA